MASKLTKTHDPAQGAGTPQETFVAQIVLQLESLLNGRPVGGDGARQTEAHLTRQARNERELLLVEAADGIHFVATEVGLIVSHELHALRVAGARRTDAPE